LNLKVITHQNQLGQFLSDLATVDTVYIDTETSSVDTFTCKLYLLQVLVGDVVYVFDCLQFNQIEYIVSLLASKTCVGHNIKFDIRVLYSKTHVLLAKVFDTMLGEVMLHQGIGIKYVSLYEVVKKYTGQTLNKEVRETFYNQGELTTITQEQIIYSAEDILYLPKVMEGEVAEITRQNMLKPMKLEMELCPVVAMMEQEGVHLNVEEWTRLMIQSKQNSQKVAEELRNIFVRKIDWSEFTSLLAVCNAVGIVVRTKKDKDMLSSITQEPFYENYLRENINIASTTQLLRLVRMSGYPELDSTAEKVITDYVGKDPDQIFEKIIEFREQFKRGTSFGQGFLDDVNPLTGKIHSTFHQLGTATGRFSSGNPNLQQIVAGSDYRKCFMAPPGWKMIIADYSQQELRLAGAASKEPEIINAYKNGIDLHTLTASALFEKELEEVDKRERSIAKGFNFAVLYGSSEYGLAHNFGFPVDYTKQLLDNFYNKYKTLKAFKNQFEGAVLKKKYSRTLYGRIRYFEDKSFFPSQADAYRYMNGIMREGFNHLIQGTAADATKLAMCNIFYGNPFGENLKIIMTIHDELVCIAKEDYALAARDYVVKCMNDSLQPFLGEIPSEVDSNIQDYWYKS